jgi:SAM-dependent methyltransferase
MSDDPKEIVRRGYDAIAETYAAWQREPEAATWPAMRWLHALDDRLPPQSYVLDLGCGNGRPAATELARRHRVRGIDISTAQIELARRNVPEADFEVADAAELMLPPESIDAAIALFMLWHMPRPEARELVRRVAAWLRPGGLLLATLGARSEDRRPRVEEWLGAPMYFAGLSEPTSRRWLEDAGFDLLEAQIVPQIEHGEEVRFLWVLAQKPK